eukprot:6491745-Amphidinium_carterae.1
MSFHCLCMQSLKLMTFNPHESLKNATIKRFLASSSCTRVRDGGTGVCRNASMASMLSLFPLRLSASQQSSPSTVMHSSDTRASKPKSKSEASPGEKRVGETPAPEYRPLRNDFNNSTVDVLSGILFAFRDGSERATPLTSSRAAQRWRLLPGSSKT